MMRRLPLASILFASFAVSTAEAAGAGWEFSISAYGYFVPDESDYVQPSVTADHGALHLEARYNYEDRDTASLWAGRNFGFGDKVTFELTPMLGAVFGDTDGIAPGFRAALDWRWLSIYTEAEYLFDTGNSDDSFFYAWSEASVAPVSWFRFGVVGQRTRVYDLPRDVQRGFLVGFSVKSVDLSGYVFNPGDDDPLYVAAVSFRF